jgi:hypothetical protein
MKIILLVIGIVFVVNSNFAFAKDMYFDCDGQGNFKYSKSWFGKGQFFYEKEGEWVRDKDAKINDDKVISPNWTYIDSGGRSKLGLGRLSKTPPSIWVPCNRFGTCKYKEVISLVLREGAHNQTWVDRKRIITSKQCSAGTKFAGCNNLSAGNAIPDTYTCTVVEQ